MENIREILKERGVDVSTFQPLAEIDGRELYRLDVPGAEAIERWRQLRALHGETGYWPVLLGSPEGHKGWLDPARAAEALLEAGEKLEPVAQIIARGEALDIEALLRKRIAEIDENDFEDFEEEMEEFREELQQMGVELPDELLRPPADEPGDGPGGPSFTIPRDIMTGEFLKSVVIGLIPADKPWHVPAWLRWGGWNDCPPAEEQVAFLKRWNATHGAEPVGMASDIVELLAAKRPANAAEALEVAREQYVYCADIVDQGTGTLEKLAGELLKSDGWFFWWD